MGAGRPSKDVLERLAEISFDLEKVEQLMLKGFTDGELARVLGVSERTINRWKNDSEEFAEALRKAKEQADAIIEASLFHRAKGYSHSDVHISQYKGDVIVTEITKHYPPDTTAAIFWLKNRQPNRWRDKTQLEIDVMAEALDKLMSMTPDERKALYSEYIQKQKEK